MLCVFTSINPHFSITNHLIILFGSGFRIQPNFRSGSREMIRSRNTAHRDETVPVLVFKGGHWNFFSRAITRKQVNKMEST